MATLLPRQVVGDGDGDVVVFREHSFWWTRDGQIVRWSVFFGVFFLFLGYMMLGYWHAKRRLRKGLPPLAYHRWLLSRQQRAQFDPSYQNPSGYYTQYPPADAYYGMQPMAPPMYNPNAAMPPTYQPPAGATKVDPSQWRSEPTRRPEERDPSPSYQPPPGPPPTAIRPEQTGENNPYRP